MIPNSAIYGTPDTWLIAGAMGTNADSGNKLSAWQTLGNAVLGWGSNSPVMDINTPLDTTISFCGIGNDTEISQIGVYDMTTGEELENNAPFVTNWFLGYVDSPYPITRAPYNVDYDYNNTVWSPIDSLGNTNPHRFIRPFVSLSFDDTVLLVSVRASNSDFSNSIQAELLGYDTTYKTTYPNITGVFVTPYKRGVSSANSRTPYAYNNSYYQPVLGRLVDIDIPPNWGSVINYNDNTSTSNTRNICIWGINSTSPYYINTGYHGDNYLIHHTNSNTYIYRPYAKEWVLSAVAALGLFFTDSETYAINAALDSEYMYCGTIDSNGITHGEYTRGEDNREQQQYTWSDSTESSYDPSAVLPDYDTKNHFNPYIGVADFNAVYVTNYDNVRRLCRELYKAIDNKPPDTNTTEYSADTFLVTDPINGIISVRKYPVNIVPNNGVIDYIKIGNYTSDTIQGYRFAPSENTFINFTFSGTKALNEEFGGSFLDREPYTTAELYIPFCGTVAISVSDYIGHNITVKLSIDYRSGSCTAYVLKDSTPLQSANGQIGIDIAVSGASSAEIDSQLLNANLRLKESQRQQFQASTAFFTTPASIAGSLLGGKFGMTQAAGSLGSLTSMGSNFENAWDRREAASYDLHHIQTPYKTISAGSPLCSAMGEHCCRLTIYRPILMAEYDAAKYGHTVGFAVLLTDTLSNHSGYCVTASCDLSGVTCTAEERSMIDSALKGGVYL